MQFNFNCVISQSTIVEAIKDYVLKTNPDIDREDIAIEFAHSQVQGNAEYTASITILDSNQYAIKRKYR